MKTLNNLPMSYWSLFVPGTIILFLVFMSFHVETVPSFWTVETLCLMYFLIREYFGFGGIDLIILCTCLIRVRSLWTNFSQVYLSPLTCLTFLSTTKCSNFTKCYFLEMLCLDPFLSLLLPPLLSFQFPFGLIQVSLPPEELSFPFHPPSVDLMYFLRVSLA